MIKVRMAKTEDAGAIIVHGHAPRVEGAEEDGNLACAAASYIAQVTAAALREIAGADVRTTGLNANGGVGTISWTGGGQEAETIFKEFVLGVGWLAESYPGSIGIDTRPARVVR